ncbi:MAG: hypothetical protein ABID71_00420 [Chloroflexota bacterium]
MSRFRLVLHELAEHVPFTAAGAVTGIIVMVIVELSHIPREVSEALFYTLHPLHVAFSAVVVTALYRLNHKKPNVFMSIIIAYLGAVVIATVSDVIFPYLEGNAISIEMEFHLPFLETEIIPYLGIPEWVAVNAGAAIGIAVAFFRPSTKLPHMGHILVSTWASLFAFTAFGSANWIPLLPLIFVFLFFAVWIPCCFSDIVFPLLWARGGTARHHHH